MEFGIGIHSHLKRISSELFIKKDSDERMRINRSVKAVSSRLREYFGSDLDRVILFGSYSRDTILPRIFDGHSDIDVMVQFSSTRSSKLKPESYRSRLKKFAIDFYPGSKIIKDHPSIVLELNHIKIDLVPAIFDEGFFYDSIEIPDKNGGWLETDPDGFNAELTKANIRHNSVIKPVIRLLKYWNAVNGYPYNSFELEKFIATLSFDSRNFEDCFFYVVKKLRYDTLSSAGGTRLDSLKSNTEKVDNCLNDEDLDKAKKWLSRIFPGF